jgi:hypothetical protein
MKRVLPLAIVCVCLVPSIARAKDPDPRLATVKTAWVEAVDELDDDKPVAVCMMDHLARTTPLAPAASRDAADVVLTVKAHLPGNSMRQLTGVLGTVTLTAKLPNDTLLWSSKEDVRAGKSLAAYAAADIPCSLADGAADKLRQAMRKARGK